MSSVKNFHDLKIWHAGKAIVLEIYELTKSFPREEMFGLTSQMRRAAVSVPANISEGFNRFRVNDQKRFMSIALGSCAELETLLEISFELKYVQADEYDQLIDKIDHESRMIMKLKMAL